MNKKLQIELIEILEYFKEGLDDIEAGRGERQPMSDEIDNALGKVKKLAIPNVRCFKASGEELIKVLGFDLDDQYDHDQFHTTRYRKGLLIVEFTYESEELLTVELTIDETFCKSITFKELEALTSILGEYPE